MATILVTPVVVRGYTILHEMQRKLASKLETICISQIAKNLHLFSPKSFTQLPEYLIESILSHVIKKRLLNDHNINLFVHPQIKHLDLSRSAMDITDVTLDTISSRCKNPPLLSVIHPRYPTPRDPLLPMLPFLHI
jgi:hypothetical protein